MRYLIVVLMLVCLCGCGNLDNRPQPTSNCYNYDFSIIPSIYEDDLEVIKREHLILVRRINAVDKKIKHLGDSIDKIFSMVEDIKVKMGEQRVIDLRPRGALLDVDGEKVK